MSSQSSNSKADTPADLPSLVELIPPQRIALNVEAADWHEATRIAGQLLLDTGAITAPYIDAMISTAERLGPYIVIAPGIALPHARPEDGALKTALSLISLKNPLDFGNPDHDPVKLVIALAAVDKNVHVRAMRTLALLLMSKPLVEKLMNASSQEEVYALFEQADSEDDE